jgi:hypothetical protein
VLVDAPAASVSVILLPALGVPDAFAPLGRPAGQMAPAFEITALGAFPFDQAALALAARADADRGSRALRPAL